MPYLSAPVDSNWADCRTTRKSTSGGALRHGAHVLCTWSVTQAVQALSSGEAEFYSVLKGVVEALGFQAVATELGCTWLKQPRVGSDSSAARGAVFRHGLGKLKHMDLKYLWVQGALRAGRFGLYKELGDTNFGDLMTKHLGMVKMEDLSMRGGFAFREGRAPEAPQLEDGAATQRISVIFAPSALGMG